MKIRTDFVTNSSSSSYCVSLGVKPVGKKKTISLNLWPDGEDGSGDVWVGMHTELDEFVDQIKNCSTVDELRSLLVNLLDFSAGLDDVEINHDDSNDMILQALSEISKGAGYALQIVEAFNKFNEAVSQIASLDDIKSITITEYFTGWGEFAGEGVEDFLSKATPKGFNWNDENSVKALKDRFGENELEYMMDQLQNDAISMFNASINTTIELATGIVTKKCEFEDMS